MIFTKNCQTHSGHKSGLQIMAKIQGFPSHIRICTSLFNDYKMNFNSCHTLYSHHNKVSVHTRDCSTHHKELSYWILPEACWKSDRRTEKLLWCKYNSWQLLKNISQAMEMLLKVLLTFLIDSENPVCFVLFDVFQQLSIGLHGFPNHFRM